MLHDPFVIRHRSMGVGWRAWRTVVASSDEDVLINAGVRDSIVYISWVSYMCDHPVQEETPIQSSNIAVGRMSILSRHWWESAYERCTSQVPLRRSPQAW
jgi:hypothetical protein